MTVQIEIVKRCQDSRVRARGCFLTSQEDLKKKVESIQREQDAIEDVYCGPKDRTDQDFTDQQNVDESSQHENYTFCE